MANQTNDAPDDREAAVREWEKQANASMVAGDRKKRLGGVAIAAVAAAAIAGVWLVKHSGNEPAKSSASNELSIADRKPVPKLKEQDSPIVPAVTSAPAATPASTVQTDDPMRVQREQMEMQRREQARRLLEARMKSAIIPPNSTNQPGIGPQSGAAPQPGGQARQSAGMLGGASGDQGAQDANSRFVRSVSGNGVPVSMASRVDDLPYKVLQGEFIEAVLEPRAISDLPGQLCALIQRDVYGAQGRIKLIPWGSRVCGTYNAELRKGQDRLFVVWNTLRRPDGVQVAIDSAGGDQLGTAGMGGIVDTHFAEIFGMSALLSIIGAGASNVGVSSGDQYNSASQYRQSVQQAAAQSSQQVLSPYINMQPTVTVPAGSRVRIYVNKDLDFTSIYKDEIDAAKHGEGVTFIQ